MKKSGDKPLELLTDFLAGELSRLQPMSVEEAEKAGGAQVFDSHAYFKTVEQLGSTVPTDEIDAVLGDYVPQMLALAQFYDSAIMRNAYFDGWLTYMAKRDISADRLTFHAVTHAQEAIADDMKQADIETAAGNADRNRIAEGMTMLRSVVKHLPPYWKMSAMASDQATDFLCESAAPLLARHAWSRGRGDGIDYDAPTASQNGKDMFYPSYARQSCTVYKSCLEKMVMGAPGKKVCAFVRDAGAAIVDAALASKNGFLKGKSFSRKDDVATAASCMHASVRAVAGVQRPGSLNAYLNIYPADLLDDLVDHPDTHRDLFIGIIDALGDFPGKRGFMQAHGARQASHLMRAGHDNHAARLLRFMHAEMGGDASTLLLVTDPYADGGESKMAAVFDPVSAPADSGEQVVILFHGNKDVTGRTPPSIHIGQNFRGRGAVPIFDQYAECDKSIRREARELADYLCNGAPPHLSRIGEYFFVSHYNPKMTHK